MKRGISIIIVLMLFCTVISAKQTKIINKSFKVEPNKTIEFEDFSSLNVKISSWDKDEIGFNLKAYVESSDNDFEKFYINSLDIQNEILGSRQIISLVRTDEKGGFSFLGLFKIRIGYHFSSEIKGEIFLPKNLSLNLDFRYSDIVISGINGVKEINGRGNDLSVFDCTGMSKIDNNYGKITLEKCKGDINLKSRSTNIEINDHIGDLIIESDYTNIKINNVDGRIGIADKSGDIEIKNAVVKNLDIPYSNLEIRDMNPRDDNTLYIKGKSSTIEFYNVKSNMEIESDYTNVKFRNITGDIFFEGKSCDVKGDQVVGNLDVDATYSGLYFRELNANKIKISHSNNTIDLTLNSEPQQIDIINKYGKVDITMPSSYEGDIDLQTRYGQIRSDFDLNYHKGTSEIFAYSKGKSSKKHIKIENYSGDISLRK